MDNMNSSANLADAEMDPVEKVKQLKMLGIK